MSKISSSLNKSLIGFCLVCLFSLLFVYQGGDRIIFDELANIEAALSFLSSGKYNSLRFGDNIWTPHISTGLFFTLPQALIMKWGGSLFLARLLLQAILLMVWSGVFYLSLKKIGTDTPSSIVSTILSVLFILYAIPHHNLTYLALGEFPSFILITGSIFLWNQNKSFVALALSFAIWQGKIIFLLLALSLLVHSLLDSDKKQITKSIYLFFSVKIFELLFILIFHGPAVFSHYMEELFLFLGSRGSGIFNLFGVNEVSTLQGLPELIHQKNIEIYDSYHLWFFLIFGGLTTALLFIKSKVDRIDIILISNMILYAIWFFTLAQTGWARHFVPVTYCLTILFIYNLLRTEALKNISYRYLLTLCLFLTVFYTYWHYSDYTVGDLNITDDLIAKKCHINQIGNLFGCKISEMTR